MNDGFVVRHTCKSRDEVTTDQALAKTYSKPSPEIEHYKTWKNKVLEQLT